MGQKITLIEYNDGTYAGDDLDPDIQYRDCLPCVSGKEKIVDDVVVDIVEVTRRIEDMRNYAYIISSSSSSSLSSSSETPQEELFEHHETGGDSSYTIGQTSYSVTLAQTFTPDIAHQISRVELELFDNQGAGITGTITVEIKATSGGLPTGAALASGTIDAADLNPSHMSSIYNNINLDAGADYGPYGVYVSPDGTMLFYTTRTSGPFSWINKAIMSVPWDLSTAVYDSQQQIFEYAVNYYYPFFSPDGNYFYVTGEMAGSTADVVFQYACTNPWDIENSDFSSSSAEKVTSAPTARGLAFSADGSKMYLTAEPFAYIQQYSLSTPWLISTAGSASSKQINATDSTIRGLFFRDDGKKLIVAGDQNNKLYFYNLSTAWNLSTATKDSYEMDISTPADTPLGIAGKANGKRLYVVDATDQLIYQFDLPALRGDWHEADLGEGFELDAATKYVIEATYDNYEAGVSEPEWVNNADGEDNYEAGTLLRHDGSNWYDS